MSLLCVLIIARLPLVVFTANLPQTCYIIAVELLKGVLCMGDNPLCFRTFAECIREHMKTETVKKFFDKGKNSFIVNKDAEPINGTEVFHFYTLLLEAIMYIGYNNEEVLPDIDNTKTTKLKNGTINVPEKIVKIAERQNSFNSIALYFGANLLPNFISKNVINTVLDAVDALVQGDLSLGKKAIATLKKARVDKTPSDYLTEVYILAVRSKRNKIPKEHPADHIPKTDEPYAASDICFEEQYSEQKETYAEAESNPTYVQYNVMPVTVIAQKGGIGIGTNTAPITINNK